MTTNINHNLIKARHLERTTARGAIITLEVMAVALFLGLHFSSWMAGLAGFLFAAMILCGPMASFAFFLISAAVGYGIGGEIYSNTHNMEVSSVAGLVAGLICYGMHKDSALYLEAIGS